MGKKRFFNFKNLFFVSFLAVAGIFSATAISSNNSRDTRFTKEASAGTAKVMYLDLNGHPSISNCYLYMKGISGYNTWPGKVLSSCSGYGTVTARYTTRSTTKSFYTFNIDTSATEIALTNSSGSTYYGDKWDITAAKNTNWNLVQMTGWGESYNYNAHHMHKIQIVDESSTTYEYNPAEWGNYCLPTHKGTTLPFIGWYKDGDKSGTRLDDGGSYGMPTDNINDFNFTAVYDDTSYTVIFKSESGTTLSTQTIYKGKSASYTIPAKPDEGGKQYTADKWRDSSGNDKTAALANVQSDLTVYASYTTSYKSGRYAVGVFGGGSWDVEHAVYMPYVEARSQYEGSITLAFGDKFKIAYYNGSSFSSYYGYHDTLSTCGAFHYFTNDVEDNLVCYARGTYSLYFTDGSYGEEGGREKKISIELASAVNAEHLAAKLMAFGEWEGHCGDNDRFPAMKTIYLGLSSTEKTTFQGYASSGTDQFKNAYDRYTAWARALGENPWAAGKASAISSFSPFNLMNEDGTDISTVIIIIASSVALLSITTLSVLMVRKRKRKEE